MLGALVWYLARSQDPQPPPCLSTWKSNPTNTPALLLHSPPPRQIPTTRALSLVTTGDQVMRDMFYNGNVKCV